MNFLYDNFISEFLFMAMRWVFSFFQDYSLVIIVVTLAIKLVLLPLDLTQRKSSRLMSTVTGDVEEIKKRYANNPDQVNKKVQALYKERGIKPMSGCLPMLVTMVLLFAFYGALRNVVSEQSVALVLEGMEKGAQSVQLPRWLWVNNIFQPDSGMASILPTANEFLSFIKMNSSSISPQMLMMLKNEGILTFANGAMSMNAGAIATYETLCGDIVSTSGLAGFNNGWFGLPLIAGGSLFLQQWLTQRQNPAAAAQQGGKMMMYFFPLFSAYICCTTNACFAIYWTVSNVVSVLSHVLYTGYYKRKERLKTPTADDFR